MNNTNFYSGNLRVKISNKKPIEIKGRYIGTATIMWQG